MDKYSTVYVPDRNGNFKLQEFEEDYHEWRDVHSEEALSAKEKVIVLTEEELLDLMQQSVERAHTTLLRERASELLNATLKYQK